MTRKLLSTLLLLIIIIEWGDAQPYWQSLSSGTTRHLHDVFFINRDTGYVVGDDSTLLRTFNGGSTWTALPKPPVPAPGNLRSIWMWPNGNGLLGTDFISGFLQTSNGGNSWTTVQNGPGNPCYTDGLYFASPAEGYLFGTGCFNGAYVASYNGSWSMGTQLYYNTTPSFQYIGLTGVAKDPASNAYSAVGNYGLLMHSTNGFTTFDTLQWTDTTNFSAVDAAGNNTFYAVSRDVLSDIYESTDGGQSYHPDPTYLQTFYYPAFNDVAMHGNDFGVAVGTSTWAGGMIFMRNTQGWTYYESVPQHLEAVYVVDTTLAFAVGDSGAIYRYNLPTGMAAAASAPVNIFPSPAAPGDELTLEGYTGQNVQLDVFDATGRRLLHARRDGFNGHIAVDAFTQAPGLYLLRITAGGRSGTARILVR